MIAAGAVLDGRYRLDHLLARGGFARVFLGSDLRLRRYVAIKVLHPELLDAPLDQDFRARFATEAAVVARLDHPNILGVHDYGEAEGTLYLVMPYVAGGTLEDRLRGTPGLGLDLAGHYLRQAAAALDYAHGHGVVHRDVKPQNMLLHADGDRLLLADFGIARLIDAATALRSRTATLGTLAYMAPEQFQGRAGPATDVYALGCVLFQLLTGEVPYTGPTEQVMFAHVWGAIPSVVERSRGSAPAALQAVVDRALAKRPEERFPSAGALVAAFDAAVGEAAPAPARADPPPVPPKTRLGAGAPTLAADPPVAVPYLDQVAGPPPPAADGPAGVAEVAAPVAPAPDGATEAGRAGRRVGASGVARLARALGVAALVVVALLLALTQLPVNPPAGPETIFGAATTEVNAVFICGVVLLALVAAALAWPPPGG
ncbi:MAG TPA: serine/threonine-protein kinase, partial [Thermomicrobiales bacterium]|nr:serine/threonine-protein kinase [Thermomicrobiales bacterium]